MPEKKSEPAKKPMPEEAAHESVEDSSADSETSTPQASGPPAKLGLGGLIVLLIIIAIIVFVVMRGGSDGGSADGTGDDEAQLCENTCDSAGDGECDDGGEGAAYDVCSLGTDCDDCGPRPAPASE